MYISEALTRTYAVAGRLPDPVATRGPGTADPVPALSIAAWRAITAITAVAGAAGRLLRVFRRQRTHRATARSLRALDDRTLADIGLPRNAIDAVAGALTARDGQPGPRRSGTKIATAAASRSAANDNNPGLAA